MCKQGSKTVQYEVTKYCVCSNHARAHSMTTERRHHTRHGLHLNKKGRDWIVNNIIKEIRKWKSSCRVSSPIELPWKNETKDLVIVSVERKA